MLYYLYSKYRASSYLFIVTKIMFLNTTLEHATCVESEHQVKIVFPGTCAGGGIHEVKFKNICLIV